MMATAQRATSATMMTIGQQAMRQPAGERETNGRRGASRQEAMGFRGRCRVERMRGGGINTTTSHRTRDYRGGGKSDGDGNGDRECRTPPSWDLAATALVLRAEASAALIADDADGGNSGVTIVGSASLVAGGGLIN